MVCSATLLPLCTRMNKNDLFVVVDKKTKINQTAVSVLRYLQQQFYHLGVDQALDGLSVHVGDEVPGAQTCLVSRAALLHTLLKQQHREREQSEFISALHNHLFIPLCAVI